MRQKYSLIAPVLLLLFVWQLAFVCGNFLLQDELVNTEITSTNGESEDDESSFDDLVRGMLEEEVEDHFEKPFLIYSVSLLKKENLRSSNDRILAELFTQLPFSPPEMNS